MGAAHTKGMPSKNLSIVAEKIGPFDPDLIIRVAALMPFLQFKDTPEGVILTPMKPHNEAKDMLADMLEVAAGACFQLSMTQEDSTRSSVLCHNAQLGGWTLSTKITSRDVQDAYLVSASVAPTVAIRTQLPWCSVPGFVDTHAKLVDRTETFEVPTLLVPHMLNSVLQHGGSVDVLRTAENDVLRTAGNDVVLDNESGRAADVLRTAENNVLRTAGNDARANQECGCQ